MSPTCINDVSASSALAVIVRPSRASAVRLSALRRTVEGTLSEAPTANQNWRSVALCTLASSTVRPQWATSAVISTRAIAGPDQEVCGELSGDGGSVSHPATLAGGLRRSQDGVHLAKDP